LGQPRPGPAGDHHRPDPETPLEETMGALDYAVRSGRALYAGISQYPPQRTLEAARILRSLGTPCLIHQPRYSMFDRWVEDDKLLTVLEKEGIGCIAYSPLAQGLLTDKYLGGIPDGSTLSLRARLFAGDGVTVTAEAPVRIDAPWLELREQAQKRVVNTIVLDKVAGVEKVQVVEGDIDSEIQNIVKAAEEIFQSNKQRNSQPI
jgi:L-glyceraldehyde 3-phosphate reductase